MESQRASSPETVEVESAAPSSSRENLGNEDGSPAASVRPESRPASVNQGETHTGPEEGNHRSPKLEGIFERPKALRRQNGFVYLTAFASVMIIINIVQASLIQHISSYGWIVGFPAAIFGVFTVALIVWAILDRHALVTTWRETPWPKRAAWLGIILSIFLTIILCEFVYLPVVAVPAYQSVEWSTSIRAEQSQIPPAVLLVPDNPYITFFTEGTNASASIQYGSGPYSKGKVSTIGHYDGAFPSGAVLPLQWLSFTPDMPETGVDIHNLTDSWWLGVNLTYNSTDPINGASVDPTNFVPEIMVVLYDSTLPLNYSEIFTKCGASSNRPFGPPITIPALNAGSTWPVYVETFRINDEARELNNSAVDTICQQYVRDYKYYDVRPPSLSWDRIKGVGCDIAQNGTGPCQTSISFELVSPLVTIQTSRRGTDALKIFIDEGSILGGILFITWFFGIFII